MNHRILNSPACLSAFVPLCLLLSGCGTVTTLASIVPTLLFNTAETVLLDAFAQPSVLASAGPDELILTGETVILNGSGSGIVTGGGSLELSSSPPLTFAWEVVSSPVPDQNNDGAVNNTDLALAGVRLTSAETPFPRFASPVPGIYLVQATVSWTAPSGVTLTSSDIAQVGVSAPAP